MVTLINVREFFRSLWFLVRPYWYSEERWPARGLLAIIVGMNLGLVYLNVLFNEWNNAFYDSLQNKNFDLFLHQLILFSGLAALFIVVAVYQTYLRQMLLIRWRRWLTDRTLNRWLSDRAYYLMPLAGGNTDNPDQRIADDIDLFVSKTLAISLDLLSSVVTLFSFAAILWSLSGPLEVGGVVIPGYMLWAALLYAILGSFVVDRIGRPLVAMSFNQQRFEADFRFSLVRLRENAEGVALYGGEQDETGRLTSRFGQVVENWWRIMRATKRLTFFTAGYSQIAIIFPYVVAAPRFFAGAITLGGLMQTASAFGQVRSALSWFVESYGALVDWKATVDRLTGFHAALNRLPRRGEGGIQRGEAADRGEVAVSGLAVSLPDGRSLWRGLDASFARGEAVVITGPTGCGKSTLLRALAGLWPFGEGRITIPAGARLLFLPQKPYLPIDTLRAVACYPARGDSKADFADAEIALALTRCGLPALASRLEESRHWANVLSQGEQQRLAIARALLHRPDWLFLDEATSAMGEADEVHLYRLLRQELPDAALVSVGHRASLLALQDREISLSSLSRVEAATM
ncbi:MAG: ABC transporter ATP-binding protein/permease [Alphaproteobacteria bacterium]